MRRGRSRRSEKRRRWRSERRKGRLRTIREMRRNSEEERDVRVKGRGGGR